MKLEEFIKGFYYFIERERDKEESQRRVQEFVVPLILERFAEVPGLLEEQVPPNIEDELKKRLEDFLRESSKKTSQELNLSLENIADLFHYDLHLKRKREINQEMTDGTSTEAGKKPKGTVIEVDFRNKRIK